MPGERRKEGECRAEASWDRWGMGHGVQDGAGRRRRSRPAQMIHVLADSANPTPVRLRETCSGPPPFKAGGVPRGPRHSKRRRSFPRRGRRNSAATAVRYGVDVLRPGTLPTGPHGRRTCVAPVSYGAPRGWLRQGSIFHDLCATQVGFTRSEMAREALNWLDQLRLLIADAAHPVADRPDFQTVW